MTFDWKGSNPLNMVPTTACFLDFFTNFHSIGYSYETAKVGSNRKCRMNIWFNLFYSQPLELHRLQREIGESALLKPANEIDISTVLLSSYSHPRVVVVYYWEFHFTFPLWIQLWHRNEQSLYLLILLLQCLKDP